MSVCTPVMSERAEKQAGERDNLLYRLIATKQSVEAKDVSNPQSKLERYLNGYRSPLGFEVDGVLFQGYVEVVTRKNNRTTMATGFVLNCFLPESLEKLYFQATQTFSRRGRLTVCFSDKLENLEPLYPQD